MDLRWCSAPGDAKGNFLGGRRREARRGSGSAEGPGVGSPSGLPPASPDQARCLSEVWPSVAWARTGTFGFQGGHLPFPVPLPALLPGRRLPLRDIPLTCSCATGDQTLVPLRRIPSGSFLSERC